MTYQKIVAHWCKLLSMSTYVSWVKAHCGIMEWKSAWKMFSKGSMKIFQSHWTLILTEFRLLIRQKKHFGRYYQPWEVKNIRNDNIDRFNWNLPGIRINLNFSTEFPHINPMVIGIWCGESRPPLNEYLLPFVSEMKSILLNGISKSTHLIRIEFGLVISDTPARSFITGKIYFCWLAQSIQSISNKLDQLNSLLQAL